MSVGGDGVSRNRVLTGGSTKGSSISGDCLAGDGCVGGDGG